MATVLLIFLALTSRLWDSSKQVSQKLLCLILRFIKYLFVGDVVDVMLLTWWRWIAKIIFIFMLKCNEQYHYINLAQGWELWMSYHPKGKSQVILFAEQCQTPFSVGWGGLLLPPKLYPCMRRDSLWQSCDDRHGKWQRMICRLARPKPINPCRALTRRFKPCDGKQYWR